MKTFSIINKHLAFGTVFTLAKATVYFVPLLLADVLSNTDFGILEYALAGLGIVVNSVINLGVPGAYPYFILRKKQTHLKSAFKLHPVLLLIPLGINQILYFGFNLDVNFYLAFNVSYIIANQVFYSTQLKSHERSILAVILDSGIYIILLVYFVLAQFNWVSLSIGVINVFIIFYALLYAINAIYNYLNTKDKALFGKYKVILRFSIHILIATFLIFLITTSGRILVEYFFDFKAVGIYAYYFRLAAIVVMIHQVVNITYFKKIYTLDPVILDKYYNLFFILIFSLSIGIYFVAPYIMAHLSNYFNDTFTTNKPVYFLLSGQMVMWIATALNSSIIDRENLASKNNIRFLVLIFLASVLLYLIRTELDLKTLVLIHYSVIFAACLIQYYSLYKKRIKFIRSIISITLFYILTVSYYLIAFN